MNRAGVAAILTAILGIAILYMMWAGETPKRPDLVEGRVPVMNQVYQGASIPGTAAMQQDAYGIPGLWWDDALWTPVVLPAADPMMICRVDSTGTMRCIALPPVSILFLPVPQED